ncbi:MAG: hypothetical protein HLX50_16525 [Alteromonadaceae bacterium]|nr:hypothetical protein [Alteromonadaceae bacterium]
MECPSINSLVLDERDVETLEQIRKIIRNMDFISVLMPAGVMHSIFTKNNAAGASYNIATFEWRTFASAMSKIPSIKRRRIRDVAGMRSLDPGLSPNQRQFWRAVYKGCEVENAL